MNDWQDRCIDAALHELHGQRPPDLSARVILALREGAPAPLPQLAPAPLRVGWLAAAGLLLSAVLTAALWPRHPAPAAAPQLQVTLEVLAGTLLADAGLGTVANQWSAGDRGDFLLQPGSHLRCGPPTAWRCGAFGGFTATAHTELEVQHMEFTVRHGVAATAALTVAVVAGVITWHALERDVTASTGQILRIETQPSGTELAADHARLLQRIRDLEQERDALLAARTAVPAAPPAAAEASAAATPPPAFAALFDDPHYHEALAKVDWALVGKVTDEMQPLLVELVAALEKDGEVSTELAVKIQALNAQLVNQLPALLKANLPGFGPNGAYTHPLFVANSLASTLAAAGLPLDTHQAGTLASLVRAFSAESQALADQPAGLAAERLLAETELKQRLYAELQSQLTPQQLARLYPEGSTRYDGVSLFHTGLMTRPYTQGLPASSPADFAQQASRRLGEQLGLDGPGTERVRAIVESIAGSARELWSEPADRTETTLRMVRSERTAAAMRAQLAILRELQRQMLLTPEQQQKLAQLSQIYVPLPR